MSARAVAVAVGRCLPQFENSRGTRRRDCCKHKSKRSYVVHSEEPGIGKIVG